MKSDKEAVSLMEEWAESNVCLMYYEPQKKACLPDKPCALPRISPCLLLLPTAAGEQPPHIFKCLSLGISCGYPTPLDSPKLAGPKQSHGSHLAPGVNTASRAHRNSYSRYVVFTIMKITRIVKPDE